MVKELCAAGADVNKASTDDCTTPLMAAIIGSADAASREASVEHLIAAGADVNKARTDTTGVTPLIVAVAKRQGAVVSQLLVANASTKRGRTTAKLR